MNNKTKHIIFNVISYLLIRCMFVPFIYTHIYLRKNGVEFKHPVVLMIGSVLIFLFLICAIGKLMGINALTRNNPLKPNWVNFLLSFVRIVSITYANTTSDYTATYARLGTLDQNRAIQKIYTLWVVAIIVIFASGLIEEIYNKKREAENEN